MITLQNGDILHCRSKGVLGKAIRLVSRGEFNHSAIVIKIGRQVFVADSQNNGTNLKTIEVWKKEYNYSYVIHRYIHANKDWGANFRNRALSKTGVTGYDFASLILWQPILLLTGKWFGKKGEKADKRQYCSEYVAWCHEVPNPWEMSPKKLFEWFEGSENYKNIGRYEYE